MEARLAGGSRSEATFPEPRFDSWAMASSMDSPLRPPPVWLNLRCCCRVGWSQAPVIAAPIALRGPQSELFVRMTIEDADQGDATLVVHDASGTQTRYTM